MKKIILLSLVLNSCLFFGSGALAADKGNINHVVLIWLKEPGNLQMRQEFIKHSKKLNALPGIVTRQVGIVKKTGRKIADDSFDVAVNAILKDQAAFDAYMNAPLHKKIVEEKLKPLIDHAVVYDFISE